MGEYITKIKTINIEELTDYIVSRINDVIEDSTYTELSKYIDMLPESYLDDEQLCQWGCSYLNEYYKIIGRLDKFEGEEIEELKYKIYILYTVENYHRVEFTFNEFITFSRLLNVVFCEYNPKKIRKKDKEPYQSCNKDIDDIVKKVASSVMHNPHPNAYEITKFKLNILKDTLNNKYKLFLKEEFNKIDLNDELLNNVLSEKRLIKLQAKKERRKQ